MEATRAYGAPPDVFRFSLGGWLYASPDAPVWFTTAATPELESPAWDDHASRLTAT
jgi:hypothetical protein